MVARIHLQDSYVELQDDGTWTSPKADWQNLFNLLFGSDRIPSSPSAGVSPFAEQVREALRTIGGTVEWAEVELPTTEVVY